jgi:hypothetical protein
MGEFPHHGLAVCCGFQLRAEGGDLSFMLGSGLTQCRERSIEIPLSLRRCHLTNGPAEHVTLWRVLLYDSTAARGDDCRKGKKGQPVTGGRGKRRGMTIRQAWRLWRGLGAAGAQETPPDVGAQKANEVARAVKQSSAFRRLEGKVERLDVQGLGEQRGIVVCREQPAGLQPAQAVEGAPRVFEPSR